jgi:DNA-binding beta-propeller fold protein YncE
MPQCCARQRRLALVAACLLAVFDLAACSVGELKSAVTTGKKAATTTGLAAGYTRPGEPEVLVVDEAITGGRQAIGGVAGEFARVLVGEGNTVSFINPVTVGGVRDQLYIADAGARAIYRYDLTNKTIRTLGQAGGQFMGEPAGLFVETDLSFYVADPTGKQVLYFDPEGNFVRRYSDLANLSRPVDVVFDADRNQVYVADGTYSHIIVFSKFGQALFAVGSRGRGPGKFRTITALARGKDSLFVADRLELPLQEIDLATGSFRYSFGQGQIVWPTAIVLDKEQRLFVSDRSDNTIKVFDDVRLIATIGGTGSAPGRFRLIADMWMSEQGVLYVADSMNRRIQVFRVISENTNQIPTESIQPSVQ